jgi:hypothetical protein
MKRGMTILAAAALTLAVTGPLMAQQPGSGAVANADYAYFDSHPNVARALEKDPTLIDNQQFVDSHPSLHAYLEAHPNIRREFKEHPYKFMHRSEVINQNH